MVKIGNSNANQLLEHKLPDDDKITPETDSYVLSSHLVESHVHSPILNLQSNNRASTHEYPPKTHTSEDVAKKLP